jgi:Bacterial Ig-like domain
VPCSWNCVEGRCSAKLATLKETPNQQQTYAIWGMRWHPTSATLGNAIANWAGVFTILMSSIPSTSQGEADSVEPLDYDGNGLTDFLVLNGGGEVGDGPGPVELIAFFRSATPPPDTTSPRVESTVPDANATGVTPTADVTPTFSEDMDASFINGKTFKHFKKGTTTKITAAVSYDASTDTAKLDPTNSLHAGVTYKAVVTTGAKDVAGNPLDQNSSTTGLQQKAWSFTVRR